MLCGIRRSQDDFIFLGECFYRKMNLSF